MKKLFFILSILTLFYFFTSCNKDFLNRKSLTEFSDSDEWGDPALAETFLNGLYNEIPWGMAPQASHVDESRNRDNINFNFNNMIINPDATGEGDWNGDYSRIRHVNTFIENMESSDFGDDDLKNRMLGEAYFIRAFLYLHLVEFYGGVPIITKVYALDDDFGVERNSFADCIDFIVSDLDKASGMLPIVQSGNNDGRVTKGAALALKSRVLLYAASDLYNPQKNGGIVSGFSKPELLGYVGGDPAQRWALARDAAKAVIDMGAYSLYMPDPSSADEASDNYNNLFTSVKSPEDIFVRYRNASLSQGYNGWDIASNGWYGNAGVGATAEMVDAYEMSDGSKFDWNNPLHAAAPFTNRDPRLKATVLYEGNAYRQRPADLVVYDPIGVGQFGHWEKWNSSTNEMELIWGLDTRTSVANGWNGNICGAILLKFLNKTIDIQVSNQDLTWRYFRFGEMYLNYAEASIELGEEAEARWAINIIRKRAFMPDVTESGAALKERYRNERRVELAYEGHRFFDVRRWLIGSDAYHPVHGFSIVYKMLPDHTTSTIPEITKIQIQDGKWDNKAYFFPINRTETQRNPQLIQNPGYN